MKCLNCGKESPHFLCEDCVDPDILNRIFNEICTYRSETCINPFLMEYASSLIEKNAVLDIIPEILDLFSIEVSEYYYCRYYKKCKDDHFEEAALTYLQKHTLSECHTQAVLYDLIDSYIPNDFIKPQKWCNLIRETENLYCELYAIAAKYYAMIGEYDLSDEMITKAMFKIRNSSDEFFIYCSPENMPDKLEKQKKDTERYRTKKPYWPQTEKRRRAVAMFLDKKGIKHPRIESKPKKTKENEFASLKECFEEKLDDYCAFWCNEAFSNSVVKCIYQIGAVRVRNNEVTNTFMSFIRPWDGGNAAKKAAAKEVDVPVEVIDTADDVDIVMRNFFEFVENDVLVSTGALGNQAKLISRAARYTGMKEIKNEFFDLLDLAADTSSDFDLANNTREYLLSTFSILEGKNALEKALANKQLYDALIKYGGQNGR